MSITNYLNKIKTAIYGRDVRNAIHDAIKQTYDDAAEGGDANMEVTLARGSFNVLNDRLDNNDDERSQLNGKIDNVESDLGGKIDNLESELDEVRSGGLNENSISSNKLKTDSQDDRIKLVNLNEEVIQAMTGETDVNMIPADESVTIEKLSSQLQSLFITEGAEWS